MFVALLGVAGVVIAAVTAYFAYKTLRVGGTISHSHVHVVEVEGASEPDIEDEPAGRILHAFGNATKAYVAPKRLPKNASLFEVAITLSSFPDLCSPKGNDGTVDPALSLRADGGEFTSVAGYCLDPDKYSRGEMTVDIENRGRCDVRLERLRSRSTLVFYGATTGSRAIRIESELSNLRIRRIEVRGSPQDALRAAQAEESRGSAPLLQELVRSSFRPLALLEAVGSLVRTFVVGYVGFSFVADVRDVTTRRQWAELLQYWRRNAGLFERLGAIAVAAVFGLAIVWFSAVHTYEWVCSRLPPAGLRLRRAVQTAPLMKTYRRIIESGGSEGHASSGQADLLDDRIGGALRSVIVGNTVPLRVQLGYWEEP